MSPLLLLAATPFVAHDAGLSWNFDGSVRKEAGRYALDGRTLHGEVAWFLASKGRFDATALYESDTRLTKEADASKGFRHSRKDDVLAGMLAIRSDQTYLWDGVAIASRCLYCAKDHHALVIRLWWPAARPEGEKAAEAFLRTIKESL